MKFYLKVFDNYHHWDETSAYGHGSFDTYEEAVNEAKKIVREFLIDHCKFGTEPGELMALYGMYGEEPVVFPDQPTNGKSFSPRDYSKEFAEEICKYN